MLTKHHNLITILVIIGLLVFASLTLSQFVGAGEACRNGQGTANVRNNPSLDSTVVGGLVTGNCVGFYATVTGEFYNWAYIDNPSDTGNRAWVADSLINVISTPLPASTIAATPTQEITTTATATPTPSITIDKTENHVIIRLIVELVFPLGE